MGEAITVIVPFYKGNAYIQGLIDNICEVKEKTIANITNIIIVNDSPWIKVCLPSLPEDFDIEISIINNDKNYGIQRSRVNGLRASTTPLIIFLDQDDALIAEGFNTQVHLINGADIVVGNGRYQYGNQFKRIYKNKKVMEYLIQKKRFLEIRNLIPSPGCCLIRKESIPVEWCNICLTVNGADDWFLWLLMFEDGRVFRVNNENVYQHNSTEQGNLSFDLDKMHQSCMEMYDQLVLTNKLSKKARKELYYAIEFKYFQDTRGKGKVNPKDFASFLWPLLHNLVYKIMISIK